MPWPYNMNLRQLYNLGHRNKALHAVALNYINYILQSLQLSTHCFCTFLTRRAIASPLYFQLHQLDDPLAMLLYVLNCVCKKTYWRVPWLAAIADVALSFDGRLLYSAAFFANLSWFVTVANWTCQNTIKTLHYQTPWCLFPNTKHRFPIFSGYSHITKNDSRFGTLNQVVFQHIAPWTKDRLRHREPSWPIRLTLQPRQYHL